MKKHKQSLMTILATCSVVVTFLAVPVSAAEGGPSAAEGGPYLNFEAGVNFLDTPNAADLFAEYAGVSINPGLRLGGAVGYNFNSWAGVELEGGFLYNTISGRDENGKEASLGIGQVPVTANLVFRLENKTKWVPYLGGGLGGIALFTDQTDQFYGDMAYQAMLGVRRMINDKMSIGIGYKYTGYGALSLWTGETIGNHSINLGFNWKF